MNEQGTRGELLEYDQAELAEGKATRIENKHGGGVPCIHMIWDHIPLWIELKTVKNNAVKISPHQIAWHMAYCARGCILFLGQAPLDKAHIFV